MSKELKEWEETLKFYNEDLAKEGCSIKVTKDDHDCYTVQLCCGDEVLDDFAENMYEHELNDCILECWTNSHRIINAPKENYDRQQLIVKAWVYFGYNYSDPKEFIHYICEKTGQLHLEEHFISKFNHIYDVYGCYAVMNEFYEQLNQEYQAALVDFAVKEYFPNAFTLSDEDKRLLGI